MKITTTLTQRNTSTVPPAVALQLATLLSQPGAPGVKGSVWLSGPTAPGSGVGTAGDFYVDTVALALYGPKTTTWPASFATIAGTILSAAIQAALQGASAPSAGNVFATMANIPSTASFEPANANIQSHVTATGNPHGTTTINGQRDTRTDLAPADAGTATLNCLLGNAFKITSPDTGAGMDFTIALSNVPTGAVLFAIEVNIVVGVNIPTISLTGKGANVTLPPLTASRNNVWVISTWDAGTTLQVNSAGVF